MQIFFAPCKGIQDSPVFYIPHYGFWIPLFLSVELGFWLPIISGILDSLSCFSDSKAQVTRFWNPNSHIWGNRPFN